MSERITITHARHAFERLAKALDKPTGEAWTRQENGTYKANVGVWMLDNASMYGGICIEEMSNESGGTSRPFGMGRMKPAQFVDCVNFALNALYIAQKDAQK